jgi:hypothetical protein
MERSGTTAVLCGTAAVGDWLDVDGLEDAEDAPVAWKMRSNGRCWRARSTIC